MAVYVSIGLGVFNLLVSVTILYIIVGLFILTPNERAWVWNYVRTAVEKRNRLRRIPV